MTERGWGRPFEYPIKACGRTLMMLLDAGGYIAALPKKEHGQPDWQAALLLVVEQGGPTMFAWIGFMRALNYGTRLQMRNHGAGEPRSIG